MNNPDAEHRGIYLIKRAEDGRLKSPLPAKGGLGELLKMLKFQFTMFLLVAPGKEVKKV